MTWLSAFIDAIETDFFRNVSFLVGVLVAVLSIASVKSIAKRKQSADVIFAGRSDEKFQNALECLRQRSSTNPAAIVQAANPINASGADALSFRYLLNYFELISIGIDEKIYEEKMFKRSYYGTVTKSFELLKPYVAELRRVHDRPTIYQEVEAMVSKWNSAPLGLRTKS